MVALMLLRSIVLADDHRDSAWQRTEREYDRGAGRVTDDATHELDRMRGSRRPLRPIERIGRDEDRREAIERQQRRREQRPSPLMHIPPSPFEQRDRDVDPARRALVSSIMAALDRMHTEMRIAEREHGDDPDRLAQQREAIRNRFIERLEKLSQ